MTESTGEAASLRRSDALHKRAQAARARSAVGDRTLVGLIGLVLLAGGTLAALLSFGVFGAGRAARPVLDPIVVDVLRAQPTPSRAIALGAGVLLLVLGLIWAARSLRPERRPDLVLDAGTDTSVLVTASAVAEAVAAQAAALPGVGRVRARLVGPDAAPALRIVVWLTDDANVRSVLQRLDTEVLDTACTSLGVPALPTAVRLELESAPSTPRVA
jgi:hypothetical protein